MKNNTITMGASILDMYMEGWDEGKQDDVIVETKQTKGRKKSSKERASARRKKTYYKSQARLNVLQSKIDVDATHIDAVRGALRGHQSSDIAAANNHHSFGTSRGNKRRDDTAKQKMVEDYGFEPENAEEPKAEEAEEETEEATEEKAEEANEEATEEKSEDDKK